MRTLGSLEAVIAALQDDARAEIDRFERELDASLALLRQEDAAAPTVAAGAEARVSAARREARERLAQDDWRAHQEALAARETWMTQAIAAGDRKLRARSAGDRRADLERLAQEALERLTATECVLLVSSEDLGRLEAGWADAAAASAGRTIVRIAASPRAGSGGCLAQPLDGRFRFDNTYVARARRFEQAWRTALGELYARAAATPAAARVVKT